MRKTAFVIGSGIAGLSLAEMLSRNAWKVVLVEKLDKIGGEASLSTQKWLHTGWLYAALPYAHAMMGCYQSLHLYPTLYGKLFPEHILNLKLDEGHITYSDSADGWFVDDRVHYLYALNTFDLSRWEKVWWRCYLEAVVLRRLRALGYPVHCLKRLSENLTALLNHWENSPCGYKRYKVFASTDAKIDTRRVMTSLLSRLGPETEIVTGAHLRLTERKGCTIVALDGVWHKPDLVVLASGRAVREHLRAIGATSAADMVKSIKSPILVLKKSLDLPSFIRFTRNLPYTINHISYATANGQNISTVGDYTYFDVDEEPDISTFAASACRRLMLCEDDICGSYFGIKTEFTGKLARRYNHALERVNPNTYLALAGKFCQFPLLVADFMLHMGLSCQADCQARAEFDPDLVGLTVPEIIFCQNSAPADTHSELLQA